MLLKQIIYLTLRHNIMRTKRFEKLLELKNKNLVKTKQKAEVKENIYYNQDGTIDWDKLAKHISEATSGR